jgi:hypothetical protein
MPTLGNLSVMGKAVPVRQRRPAHAYAWTLQPRIFPAKIRLSGKVPPRRRNEMSWTTPVLVEICAGLEINGYLPPEI